MKEYLGTDYNEEDNNNIEESNNLTDNLKIGPDEIENCSKEKLSLNIDSESTPVTSDKEIEEFKNKEIDIDTDQESDAQSLIMKHPHQQLNYYHLLNLISHLLKLKLHAHLKLNCTTPQVEIQQQLNH